MRLDLTPENVGSVTDGIGYEYAQSERWEIWLSVTGAVQTARTADVETLRDTGDVYLGFYSYITP